MSDLSGKVNTRGNVLGMLQGEAMEGSSSSTLGTFRGCREAGALGMPVGYFRPAPELESMEVLFM